LTHSTVKELDPDQDGICRGTMKVGNVIGMEAGDGVVFLKKIENGWAEEVLKSCSGSDLRYAAGLMENESHAAIINKLKDKPESKNRFASCIFAAERFDPQDPRDWQDSPDSRDKPDLADKQDSQDKPDTRDKPGGNLAGLVMGTLQNETMWIRIFIIIPRYRRKGIGSRAAGLVFRCGKEVYGASEAMLSVAGENRAGLRFWSKLGFTEACRMYRPLFGDGRLHRVVILRKKLI
jgi:RimJ/RimL family protein N-acetyltransferase